MDKYKKIEELFAEGNNDYLKKIMLYCAPGEKIILNLTNIKMDKENDFNIIVKSLEILNHLTDVIFSSKLIFVVLDCGLKDRNMRELFGKIMGLRCLVKIDLSSNLSPYNSR